MLYVKLSRSTVGYFKPLLDPGTCTAVSAEVKRLKIHTGYDTCNGHSPTEKYPFGCNGYVTAVAFGHRQRLYSGVRTLAWFYLSSINILA
jgi:hypothetical protein